MQDIAPVSETSKGDLPSNSPVPVDQITEARSTFARQPLAFEILLEADEASKAMEFCSEIARTALRVSHVTYREHGVLFLRLHDNPATPVKNLAFLFANNPQVSVVRWTNVIGCRNYT